MSVVMCLVIILHTPWDQTRRCCKAVSVMSFPVVLLDSGVYWDVTEWAEQFECLWQTDWLSIPRSVTLFAYLPAAGTLAAVSRCSERTPGTTQECLSTLS